MAVEKVVVLDVNNRIPVAELPIEAIKSSPPATKYRVVNIYVEPTTGKLVVEYDNTPV